MKTTKISLGYSPCPNDTFIFDAMVHHRIDTEGLEFEVQMGDVEELNQKAFAGELDVTKLSYHAFLHLIEDYAVLESGSALGNHCGPLLICKPGMENKALDEAHVAIPGKYTTAHFLLRYAYPVLGKASEVLFSDIEAQVKNDGVDMGVIIHENRFTYAERGFLKIRDLGAYWEDNTGLPIPLGGIMVKRSLPQALREKVQRVLQRSIQYAFEHPEASAAYVKAHAQEMDPEVMQKHIKLYVNDYSLALGEKGRKAVQHMYDYAIKENLIRPSNLSLFDGVYVPEIG